MNHQKDEPRQPLEDNLNCLDLISGLRKQDRGGQLVDNKKKTSYGIDSPLGLISSFVFAPVYLYATVKGKHAFWDQALTSLPDSAFYGPSLDMGCGRGLVLVKTATRKRQLLGGGPATVQARNSLSYGIDIFDSGDQTGNSPETLYANIKAMGLLDDVVAHAASFTDPLPFAENHFSLVTASLSLHNVPSSDRKAAIREACRVCKPGGAIIILDLLGYVAEYEAEMKKQGWTRVERRFAGLGVVFGSWPTQVLHAIKPTI
ncbi:unnamed protein product [Aureobasidium mustum]|uniref:Methyltransferase type 11 domain-containing protein n=1 Tax=Aureobasidium mustum TaxID=2773714 RepID=A0A9N8K7S3_9PEZI|nr:unnamed protein product [Aureobasidium mustum]